MSKFQQPLWGYELTYPDNWVQRTLPDTEGFASNPAALEVNAQGPGSGHLLIRSDWNGNRQPVEQLWGQHIGKAAGMLMAKNVGSAPWQMSGASGFEAEIVLPKRDERRLWVGMLGYGFVTLQFMVSHPIHDREWFEPVATEIIKSLRFPRAIDGINENDQGIPIPPDYQTADPSSIIPDIKPGDCWSAYAGSSSAGSLQAFYVREMLSRGWLLEEFVPFPGPADLGFARLNFIRPEESITIGIMPDGLAKIPSHTPAHVVVRYH